MYLKLGSRRPKRTLGYVLISLVTFVGHRTNVSLLKREMVNTALRNSSHMFAL